MANINQIIRKTQGQQYADGLIELMLGIFMLIAATALEFLSEPLFSGGIALIGIVLSAIFFERLQMKISVPRTGYVRYQDQSKKGRRANGITAVLTLIVVLSIFLWQLTANPNNALAWLGLTVSIVIGLALLILGIRLHMGRLIVHGVISLLLGLWIVLFVREASSGAMSIYFFGVGISLAIAGAIVLSRFIKENPLQKEGSDE